MTTLDLPRIETKRLILRPPQLSDLDPFSAFLASERARFVGGPKSDPGLTMRAFGHLAGLWVLRGYSCFVAERKETAGAIGLFGLWFPATWPEPEMSWSLWQAEHEGQGFATEAVRALLPWSYDRAGIATFISVVDAANHASRQVAQQVGARVDAAATLAANSPGSPFYAEDDDHVAVYRHRRAA